MVARDRQYINHGVTGNLTIFNGNGIPGIGGKRENDPVMIGGMECRTMNVLTRQPDTVRGM
jgi:hypothetical protein